MSVFSGITVIRPEEGAVGKMVDDLQHGYVLAKPTLGEEVVVIPSGSQGGLFVNMARLIEVRVVPSPDPLTRGRWFLIKTSRMRNLDRMLLVHFPDGVSSIRG